jgi:hypothetical protein
VFELLFTASIITALVVFAGRHFRERHDVFVLDTRGWYQAYQTATELPCPWCGAETSESDVSCPSCHQPFGAAASR